MEHRFGRRHDVQLTTRIHLDESPALVIHSSDRKGTGLVLAKDLPEAFYRDVTGSGHRAEQAQAAG